MNSNLRLRNGAIAPARTFFRAISLARLRKSFLPSCLIGLSLLHAAEAHAGFLVGNNAGAMGGNDTLAKVIEEINQYNAANDPDLTTDISLFKKTDDDSAFVFNMANGFMFFEDAAGTIPVTSEGALTSRDSAYFKYTGATNILYYSVNSLLKNPNSIEC